MPIPNTGIFGQGMPLGGMSQTTQAPQVTPPTQGAPTAGRGATNLFSDEQEVYNRMQADGLDDTRARALISKKRKTLLKDISVDEAKVLTTMQADGLDSETAVKVLRANRYKNLPLWKKALKVPFDASVGATGMATEQVGNILDVATLGKKGFGEQGREARGIGERTTGDSFAAKAGETILGAGEIFAVSPTKVASTLGGRALQGAATFGAIGAAEPILAKGSDATAKEVLTGGLKGAAIGAIATPVLEKAVVPIIGGTVKGLYKGGKGVIEKGAKYTTATQKGGMAGLGKSVGRDIKKVVTAPGKAISAGTEKVAGKILGSSAGKKELFKAASPSYATLGKDKNIINIGKNIEKGDETVLKYGFKPNNTETRALAYKGSMKKVWKQVEKARGGAIEKTNAKKFADVIDDEIASKIKRGEYIPSDEADIKALKGLSDYYRKLGDVDIPTLGGIRARLNAETSFKVQNPFGDMYNTVLKKVGTEVRQVENGIIGSVKGTQFKGLMQEYRALAETYPDIVKANIKNMRAKGSPIEESFSRISGVGDIIGGGINILTKGTKGVSEVGKGLGKIALGKVYGKIKDPDFLIKEGYKKLSKSLTPKTIKNVRVPTGINKPTTIKYSKKPTKISGQKLVKPVAKTPIKPTKSSTIKQKTAEIFDDLADLTRTRSKFTGGESSSIMDEIGRHFFGGAKSTGTRQAPKAAKAARAASTPSRSAPSRTGTPSGLTKAEGEAAQKALNLKEIQVGLDRAAKVSSKSSAIQPIGPKVSQLAKIKEAGSLKARVGTQFTDTTNKLSKQIQDLNQQINNMTKEEFTAKMKLLIAKTKFKQDIIPVAKNIVRLYVLTQGGDKSLFNTISNMLFPITPKVNRIIDTTPRG